MHADLTFGDVETEEQLAFPLPKHRVEFDKVLVIGLEETATIRCACGRIFRENSHTLAGDLIPEPPRSRAAIAFDVHCRDSEFVDLAEGRG